MKILIVGYGKMGHSIADLALMRNHTLVGKVNTFEELQKTDLSQVDIAIEFTHPDAAFQNITYLLENKIPVVSGSTGWLHRYKDAVDLCMRTNGTLFYASNYSVGVNIFFQVNKMLAEMMENFSEYDVDIKEIHHTEKKDSPSGTAITLAEHIIRRVRRKTQWEKGISQDHEKLDIVAKRKEDVPGTHVVRYKSAVDSIEITHTAHSRQGFAKGALLAAEWVQGKEGIFSMDDMFSAVYIK